MGFLHRAWCDRRAVKSLTKAAIVMQQEFAKVVAERNAALARVHVMETRLSEKLKHDDDFCLLCYVTDNPPGKWTPPT